MNGEWREKWQKYSIRDRVTSGDYEMMILYGCNVWIVLDLPSVFTRVWHISGDRQAFASHEEARFRPLKIVN